MPVEEEEHVGGAKADAFVPIDERVALDEAKPVRGREVGEVRTWFRPPWMSGPSDGGVQLAPIESAPYLGSHIGRDLT